MQTIKFLTTLIPTAMYDRIGQKSTYNMQDAADALQRHLHEGLCKNLGRDIELINVLPIGSFPQYYSEPFVKSEKFATATGQNNINIGFCNIKLLRKYIIPHRVYKALMCAFKNTEEGILFVYTISSAFAEAVSKFKKKKPGVKVCTIVADLPDMSSLSSDNGIIKKLFIKHLAKKSFKNISCIDAFVLLTKHMAEYMKIDKPYCVMEGISTASAEYGEAGNSDFGNEKTIMYAGTLHKRFGVLNLLQAFSKIKDENYRLIICGSGDSEEKIENAVKKDKRIRFLKQLPRQEVLKLQSKATVLVNPRQNNEDFTKYSFPSKNMEYLSSGVPVVAYKLDGIPDEYDDYIFYVKDNSVQALTDKLLEVCELSGEERAEIGRKASDFVLSQKNPIAQTKKIINLIGDLKWLRGEGNG